MAKPSDSIVDHIARDMLPPPTDHDRRIIGRTINLLWALGYIPTAPEMQAARDEHVAHLRAHGVSEEAIG